MEYAIIPVKSLADAKTRLAKALTTNERKKLMMRMFRHVFTLCSSLGMKCLVISPDKTILEYVSKSGGLALVDDFGDLNEAVEAGLRHLRNRGAGSSVIIFSDLPLLSKGDLVQISNLLKFCDAVICPDLKLSGTNIIGLNKPILFKPRFGEDSYMRHLSTLHGEKLKVKTFISMGTGLDIDTPRELAILRGMGYKT